MPKTRSAVPPDRGAGRAKPAPKPPTHELRLRGLDGTKRTYDILQESQNSKNGFLTLHLRSHTRKAKYQALAEQLGWLVEKAVEEGGRESAEAAKGKDTKPGHPGEGQSSQQPFVSEAYQETLKDFKLVEPVHSGAAISPGKSVRQTHAQVSQDKHASPEVTSGLQQATSTQQTHQPPTVEEPGLQPILGRGLSAVDRGVAKKEVEGILSSVNQSLDTASKSALDSLLKDLDAQQYPQSSAPRPSRPSPAQLESRTPVNHLFATKAHLEEVDSITKRLHEPLKVDTGHAVNTSDSLLQGDTQNQHRGLKRSRTPDPPSFTSGAPSVLETPGSSPSRIDRFGLSPARPRGRPPKAQVPSSLALPQKIVTFNTQKLPHGWFLDPTTMAPVRDPSDVSNKIKDVIQNLYDVQSQTHGFVPETQSLLIDKMAELTNSLSDLQRLTDRNISPNNPVQNIDLAPEIVDYVDDGRNPDIFTRDFVELVQRGNAVVNGKKQAFRDFSQVYAKALKEGIGGVERGVDLVMENAGIEQDMRSDEHGGGKENGEKG